MAATLARQQPELRNLIREARHKLTEYAQVDDELPQKLHTATAADPSWRGAEPLGTRLDVRRQLPWPAPPATLIASDGSQIYPDVHGIALYYLINIGTIVLRQGSGEAPDTATHCQLFYGQEDLYDDTLRLVEVDRVNALRDLRELQELARLARKERASPAQDPNRFVVALADGPLLLWMPQRLSDVQQARQVADFARELEVLRQARAVPVGYVDRPRSANVLRLLHLLELPREQIDKGRLRASPYRWLSDRLLFGDLKPGQRTALFAATSEINESYNRVGQRICFCYVNVAPPEAAAEARIARLEVPVWAAQDEEQLDAALAAVWADCALTGYPYVLARAHELAVVGRHEREAFEQMLWVELWRRGLRPEKSPKQRQKNTLAKGSW